MRIGDMNLAPQNPSTNQAVERPVDEAGSRPSAARNDALELSRLSQAVAQNGSSSARLEQLRLEVKAGTDPVSALEISKKIVDFYTK